MRRGLLLLLSIFTLLAALAADWPTHSVLSSGRWVKIGVDATGVYRLSENELRRMGFPDASKVRLFGYGGYLLSQQFDRHPANDLPQVPLLRQSDGSILFYARGTVAWNASADQTHFVHERNFYSNTAFYFLTDRSDLDSAPFEPAQTLPLATANHLTTFNDYVLYENDSYSWGNTGRALYEGVDYASNATRSYAFTLPGIIPEANGWIAVNFAARSIDRATSYTVAVGDESPQQAVTIPAISSANQYYTKATSSPVNRVWTGTKTENSVVTLTHNRLAGVSGRLDYLALNYMRSLTLTTPYLCFRSLASVGKESTFVLEGANASTQVWDVTDPAHIRSVAIEISGNTGTFTIPAGALREFVAVRSDASSGFGSVTSPSEVKNQDLHALPATDLVILVPDRKGLMEQAERLAQAHRDHDALSVTVVPAPQVYNEFSSGTPDATAYRRLMKSLRDRYPSDEERPKYLLLFGDCSYDNRMITSSWQRYDPADFLLCYQSEESLEETTSYITDDYFGFLEDTQGENLSTATLSLGIGRFPVRTEAEASAAVDKTIAYMENREAGSWKQSVCYIADDGDHNLHAIQSELLADYTEQHYPSLLVNRLYLDAYRRQASASGYTYPDAQKQLLELFGRGMLVVNYTGHGSTSAWAAEQLLTTADITRLTSPRLPLWITATCDFTRFDDAQTSAGEEAFLNAKGGAIALLTTTRVVYASQNSTLNQAFLRHIFTRPGGKRLRLGDCMREAKCDPALRGDRNKLNFSLIGDPALTLAYPDYRIRVDEFGGIPVDEEPSLYAQVKAGGKVNVKGRILTYDGAPATDFNGILHPTILDSKEEITTQNNLGEGAFTYTDRNKTLFRGSDSIRNGQFEFTFPVPLDINY
ncbi:MAG: type IX secretion system sortase PorU, partial [Prevotellaceae bacterium]|nr:type IX secretion system sortase PorU [Prevotellaceae bacterium]